uniref:Col_cuticle_N domain-containing protein n=1 Tax=Panagrellus redivivus TaxID=6233 RepID=A0A7E4ZTV6_PANRE
MTVVFSVKSERDMRFNFQKVTLRHSGNSVMLLVLLAVAFPVVSGNGLVVDALEHLNVRAHAIHQLIVGTVVIVAISVCILSVMMVFQCYNNYCNTVSKNEYQLSPSDEDDSKEKALSFQSVFRDDIAAVI